jgi:hypothetical protein
MTWTINNKSHIDKGISDYIENIFAKTLEHISRRLNFTPPLGIKPILLKYDCKQGPIVYWPLKANSYEIGLCVEGIFPHQIVYQMAHELCHIYIDPRVNGTFIEIICQKTAIDILEEMGAPLTWMGQIGVDKYITDLRIKAETAKQITLEDIRRETILERIKELENSNILYDREINDLIALKFKELFDPIDKFGLIKHIKNAIIPSPPQETSDLSTNDKTILNICNLIKSIATENVELSEAVNKLAS